MGLSTREIAAISQVASAILTVGLPAVEKIIAEFKDNKLVTIEDIQKLGESMAKPGKLFEKKTTATKKVTK